MIRVVPDRGVLVSAELGSDGAPARLVPALREGRLAIVVSELVLAESSDVLQREKLRRHLTGDQARRYVVGIAALAERATDPRRAPPDERGTPTTSTW